MTDFEGHPPRKVLEAVHVTAGLSSTERNAITLRADLRRRGQELRMNALNLELSEATKTEYSEQLATIFREVQGEEPVPEEALENLPQAMNALLTKAERVSDLFPELAALLYAQMAKLQQQAEGSPTIQHTEVSLDHLLDLVRQASEQAKDIPKIVPSSLLADAILLGIQKRLTDKVSLPPLEKIAATALTDPDLLANWALVATEEERKQFIDLLPESKRGKISAMMDKTLSPVLQDKYFKEEGEKKQALMVKDRVQGAFERIVQHPQETGSTTVKALIETLLNLNSVDSKKLLAQIGMSGLKSQGGGEKKRLINYYTAKVLKMLTDADSIAGGSLTMELLGRKDLHRYYFTYFRDYLERQGFLVKNLDQVNNWPEERCDDLFNFLKNKDGEWKDEVNVVNPFQKGAAIFGVKKMFMYAGRPDVSRHDALFAFDDIISLYHTSDLSIEQFYSQILHQVYRDTSTYEAGTAYHELNTVAQTIDFSENNLQQMRDKAARYSGIDKLRELAEHFVERKKIFESWGSLRKYAELSQLLERAEILDELQELKQEALSNAGKAKLYQFIEMLAFHPGSKVDMKAVLEFWRQPDNFLKRGDGHTPKDLHEAIQPSNYIGLPYLDLTAVELRDALVGGVMDKIQQFPPMEIIYSVEAGTGLKVELNFYDELRQQIGSRQDSTANTKLFDVVRKILREADIDAVAYIRGKHDLLEELPASQQQIVQQKIREAITQYPNIKLQARDRLARPIGKYRARVNYKSDPQAVLAGNDTSCCMPFGEGKNNVYMFNPTTALFTLEEQRGSTWRTIAQSVLTLDVDIEKSIPQVANQLKENFMAVAVAVPEAALQQNQFYASCDNIEVAPNAAGKKELIEAVYADFFRKYISFYNQKSTKRRLNADKLIIGKGNSDIAFGAQEVNTYLPVSLVGYSDKLGDQVDVIKFKGGKETTIRLKETSVRKEEMEISGVIKTSGNVPLSSADILPAAYIESRAYPTAMQEGMPRIQNYIISAEINNAAKNRPNLSLKHVDSKGRMRGYLLAYEGKENNGSSVLYIEDLASHRDLTYTNEQGIQVRVTTELSMTGGRLVNGFVDLYKRHYVDQNNLVPITLQAREETSYQIVVKQIASIGHKLGIKFDVEEMDEYSRGESRMHAIKLTPRLT